MSRLLRSINAALAENLPGTNIDQPLGFKGRGNKMKRPDGSTDKEGSGFENIVHQWETPKSKYAEDISESGRNIIRFNTKQGMEAEPDETWSSYHNALARIANSGPEVYTAQVFVGDKEIWMGTPENAATQIRGGVNRAESDNARPFLQVLEGNVPSAVISEDDNNFYDELKELARSDVSVLKNLVNLQKLYQGDDPQLSGKESALAAGVVLQKLYRSNPRAAHYLGRMNWEPELVNWMGFFDQVGNNTLAQFLGINSMEEIPLGQAGGMGDMQPDAGEEGGEELPPDAELPDPAEAEGEPVDVDPAAAADEIENALG